MPCNLGELNLEILTLSLVQFISDIIRYFKPLLRRLRKIMSILLNKPMLQSHIDK